MSDQNIDDLLNELNSMPSKKGKKKGGATKKQTEEVAVETKPVEPTPELNNDDLLNELNSVPSKKGKKKGANKKEEPPEVVESKQETQEKPVPEVIEEKKAEVDDNEDEDEKEEPEEKGEKKKKKVVVVKKKKKKEDPLMKILQEQAKKKKELEEKLQREAEEEEKRRQEEEEKQRKLEEEKRLEEERIKKLETDRLKELSKLGIKSAAELKELDQKAQNTLDQLKKQGFDNMEDFLKSVSVKPPTKKPKKKVQTLTETQEKVEEYEEVQVKSVQPEQKNEELLQYAEKEVNFNLKNEEALDDWENFDENEESPSKVKETPKDEIIINIPEPSVDSVDIKKKTKSNEILYAEPEEKHETTQMKLRSPVICILGHVDAGKTKILDKLRKTNVQEGEAGGITQQIGATFFPIENFKQHQHKIPEKFRIEPKIPGLLIIDTPGHESFQNLRMRGSSLCDLAVLVVDLMHGLQKQTLDSIEMLRRRKTPFIIALNKIDRVHQWKSTEWGGFRDSYEVQKKNQTKEFNDRLNQVIMQLIQCNLNVAIYDENPSMREYINIVPCSAVTGEGMPDMIGVFVYLSQKFLMKKLEFKEEIQCTILEVKVLEGVGTTMDVILVNGTLKIGDKIVIGGLFGPIKTTIKMLMTPHPMKEMRVKSEYITHDQISGAMGIRIFALDLENALAGSPLCVYQTDEEADKYASEISQDFNSIIKDYLSKTGTGIMVQASTLGSLEAILSFLNDKKVCIAAVGLGHLQKKDVIKLNTIHAKNENVYKENLTILAFDVKVNPEAKQYAEDNGIKIFTADIIYHLFDSYVLYEKQCIADRKKEKEKEAIFPCVVKIITNMVFNRKDPIILGVDVPEGVLKIGTPLIIPSKKLVVGVVEGIENNKKPINNVRSTTGSVSIRIKSGDANLTVGRQFDESDVMVSNV
jgi:translation initiation factor 5B